MCNRLSEIREIWGCLEKMSRSGKGKLLKRFELSFFVWFGFFPCIKVFMQIFIALIQWFSARVLQDCLRGAVVPDACERLQVLAGSSISVGLGTCLPAPQQHVMQPLTTSRSKGINYTEKCNLLPPPPPSSNPCADCSHAPCSIVCHRLACVGLLSFSFAPSCPHPTFLELVEGAAWNDPAFKPLEL